jgi:ribonuclease BN (tRNA processing enzyme)
MDPRIIFLGTGGDENVVGRQIRSSAGIVVQVDDYQFIIDPGPGCLVKAKDNGISLRGTTAVLVSHAHVNHANDLNAVISAMTYNGLDITGVVIANNTVVNGGEGISPVLSEFHKNCVEKVITIKPEQKVGIEIVEVHALKANHTDPDTVGFKLFTPKFIMVYTSDTTYSKDLIEQYKKADILILNTLHPAGTKDKEKKGLSADDIIKIITKTKPKLAIITHFGVKMVSADPLYEAREIQKATGIQVVAAVDGMAINPLSYSADLKQKTLNLYSSKQG